MTDLRTRIRDYFAGPAVHTLARYAPAALLAGSAGVVMGAIIALPAFAASGWAVVLGGLAVNFTSSLLDRLALADDAEREAIITTGLEQGDRDIQTLVAATLTQAGSEMAQALPETGRAEVIAGMETAMHQAGGSLTAIAPRYAAALRDPHTDWATLHAALHATITRVQQTMEASEEGVISGGRQQVDQTRGSFEQVMSATKKGRIENSQQIASGGTASQPRRSPDNAEEEQ